LAQIDHPSPKVWDFDEKMLYWASVIRGCIRQVFGEMTSTANDERHEMCSIKKGLLMNFVNQNKF
jgi:hypothetical protein